MKPKTSKVKSIDYVTSHTGLTYVYVLTEGGLLYFGKHNPENNGTEWQQIPTPTLPTTHKKK